MRTRALVQAILGFACIVASLWRFEQVPTELHASALLAYEQDDFALASALFQQAVDVYPSTQLQKNLALAALQSGDIVLASAAAASVASSGQADDLAWHDFILGNLAWRRSVMAETEAHGPVPPAGSLQRAIAQTEAARDAWQSALDVQNAWPQAERNLALAANRLTTLQEELRSTSSADAPESEKMPSPPDAATPKMDALKRIQLMQQLERLDAQNAAQKAAPKPKPSGGWEW